MLHVVIAVLGLAAVLTLWCYVVINGLIQSGPTLDLERLKLTQNIRTQRHGSSLIQEVRGGEKGPDARRRRKAAGEAYPWYVEPAAEGANEADGPLSAARG